MVVVDLNPINRYHALVIPRQHFEYLVDVPDELLAHLFLTTKRVSLAIRRACHPIAIHHLTDDDLSDGKYNLVAHFKIHIIPRFPDDGVAITWTRSHMSPSARSSIASAIQLHLA